MYKKKTPISAPFFDYSVLSAIVITVITMCLMEYFFSFPSSFLHPQMNTNLMPVEKGGKVCTMEYAPICGKDGKTYANSCYAKSANMPVARAGKCETSTTEVLSVTGTTITTMVSGELIPARQVDPPAPSDTTSTRISLDTINLDVTKYQVYTNNNFKYSVALPKYAYYQGLVSGDKKTHILTVALDSTSVTTSATSLVTATYYKTGLTPKEGKKSLSLDGGTLILDYTEPLSVKGQVILDAILSSAKSF